MVALRPAIRCVARRTDGSDCGNYAMHGCQVCHAHGGRAPQVRNRARQRLLDLQLPALAKQWHREFDRWRAPVAPWIEQVEPSDEDAVQSPRTLRGVAREMNKIARELRALAREGDEARRQHALAQEGDSKANRSAI